MNRGNAASRKNTDYERIARAILYLEQNYRQQPDLKVLARGAGLSEFHFQRLFRRWAGISPKRFVQYLTAGHAVRMLHDSRTSIDAAYDSGLSSGGRLHDLLVNIHAVTPGELKRAGEGLSIHYGFHPSAFGECLLAVTARGVCHLGFVSSNRRAATAELAAEWPRAHLKESPRVTAPLASRLFARGNGHTLDIDLYVRGTNFQIKIWEALLRIPPGDVVSYEELARHVQAPRAVRAVANAVAHNPVAWLIPCHRVIHKSGALGGYRWGVTRKKVLLAWEAAKTGDVKSSAG
ncbi:MAG: methylated-DNA--[protein]-cysteine S-methyltransferase [Gammaproteobacteria bacterium]|nr:methylated-DNA--[protein]-cysteine S-methyltransferase [Gammaproteobacteria bacterium]MDH3369824.1 methylated-DNA--[protein]-cysteine S-methyltransferase [Gammaproteobacteria bacterium]MDH3407356.1 methylated-DNA--[protein]-cysteine S-methyltransferase [Gammaproteobacteria bacterium]MDH3562360.1 methylated-DNA--[protein]-cysteine S-methyltransferase [Gammaproteobacteria bacterium]MDH5487278.1 methylated-DNA--[protein]-cysteine S-methyltransferase [Gammaproteobacteria bacterium]